MEPCKIEWITIPAPDLESAKTFYAEAFGFLMSKFNDRFYVFRAGNISGGLDQDSAVTGPGIAFSITVRDLPEALRSVIAHGGTVTKNPYPLGPGAGYCAEIKDPNGNVLDLYCERFDA
jgi:predicted enzyme related to lactoylglutathione lyase